ncbi:hypothetical protein ACKI2C_47590, partial [Streptomyces brasiliscabiei]|uniref:hypothetical protein n=1 Tax=Streptomyces brasiliscabiei TaxID=2736302 RepID=UPI0038F5E04A
MSSLPYRSVESFVDAPPLGLVLDGRKIGTVESIQLCAYNLEQTRIRHSAAVRVNAYDTNPCGIPSSA